MVNIFGKNSIAFLMENLKGAETLLHLRLVYIPSAAE